MKQHPILLTLALAAASTFAAAQMAPGGGPLGQQQQPGTPPGQHLPGMGEPGMGGSSGIPGQEQQQQQTSTPRVDDVTLQRELHDQFTRNPAMANVQVQVENGVVTLQGTVPDKKDKKEAKKLAEKVQGVRKVHEKLTVQPGGASAGMSSNSLGVSSGSEPEQNAEQQNTSGSISGNTSAASGTATGTSSMSQSGASTTSAPSMNPGTTPSNEGATPANTGTPNTTTTPPSTPPTASVGGVSGAAASSGQTATNRLNTGASIGAATGAPDNSAQTNTRPSVAGDGSTLNTLPDNTSMAGQIKTAFRNDPRLGNNNIDVQVTPDMISLSGSVATGKQKQTARRIADSFAANRKVIDHVTVTGQGANAAVSPGNPAASSSESGMAGSASNSGMDPNSSASDVNSSTVPNSNAASPAGAGISEPKAGTTGGSTTGTENSTTGSPIPPQATPPPQ